MTESVNDGLMNVAKLTHHDDNDEEEPLVADSGPGFSYLLHDAHWIFGEHAGDHYHPGKFPRRRPDGDL